LIIAALLGLITVLGLLTYGARHKPEAPPLAALPSVAPPSPPLADVVSEVHAAVPAEPDVNPTPSSLTPPAAAKTVDRAAPRASEQAPGAPRYTYFGGRR